MSHKAFLRAIIYVNFAAGLVCGLGIAALIGKIL